MTHAYSESYLYDAKQNLAECFDYAISNCRLTQIYFQGCLSNLDMQTNLSVEIQRLFQEYLG